MLDCFPLLPQCIVHTSAEPVQAKNRQPGSTMAVSVQKVLTGTLSNRGIPNMQGTRKNKKPNFQCYRGLLLQKRDELINHLYERGSLIATEQDLVDEGALARENVVKDLAVTNMEREIRTLSEIELSLRLLESGTYGLCGSCGSEIPSARLQALPWTRICVVCAGGGIDPETKKKLSSRQEGG
jgi:DnaK suppressor protein